MQREFNDTGVCVANRHYMVDISSKIAKMMDLIEKGKYFAINRPRQFGKTTTLSLLTRTLNQRDMYVALKISFEGVGDAMFADERAFCSGLLRVLAQNVMFTQPELADYFDQHASQLQTFQELSRWLSRYVIQTQKQVVLMIDEVDKSSGNQIFLSFLGMLRDKYLKRNEGEDHTFQSVILAGVHDVKTLKMKIHPDAEQKFNSPWNIAVDFTVDLSFQPDDIATMLRDYQREKQMEMDVPAIAEKLYYYTSGYPYLVSKLCKFIDEAIAPTRDDPTWHLADVDAAFAMIAKDSYTTTLFDSLTKHLENDSELYETVFQLVMNGMPMTFTIADPMIALGYLYGILAESHGQCVIHNRIYEQRIYAYMLSKHLRTHYRRPDAGAESDLLLDDRLNIPLILQKFQAFMKEHYSHTDTAFLEREGRLLFLAFLKPIINGKGFEFKEPAVADERRMDVVITYGQRRDVIELKIWRGPKYHQDGLRQLCDYLDIYSLKEGYLLIYDFNAGKTYKQEQITVQEKQIFAVWV